MCQNVKIEISEFELIGGSRIFSSACPSRPRACGGYHKGCLFFLIIYFVDLYLRDRVFALVAIVYYTQW